MQGIIDIKGKPYTLIAERVRLAHAERESFEMLSSAPIQIADRWVWQSVIKVDGVQYVGTSEVKLNAAKNTPDGSSPFECAETSAVGRALGFAGLGIPESIASAEEVILAVAEQSRPSIDPDRPSTPSQHATIAKLNRELNIPEYNVSELSFQDCANLLKELARRVQLAKAS
jgi:hypothetical protein